MKNRVDWLWSACVFPQENAGLRARSSPAAPAIFSRVFPQAPQTEAFCRANGCSNKPRFIRWDKGLFRHAKSGRLYSVQRIGGKIVLRALGWYIFDAMAPRNPMPTLRQIIRRYMSEPRSDPLPPDLASQGVATRRRFE